MSQFSKPKPRPIDLVKLPYFDRASLVRRLEIDARLMRLNRSKTKNPFVLSKITRPIKNFAAEFPKTESGIHELIIALKKRISFVPVSLRVGQACYAKQSAHDVFVTGKIPTVLLIKNLLGAAMHYVSLFLVV